MSSYYNDIDKFCCNWLENLIAAGLISRGRVDCRSINEISGEDVKGYTRCHFFAGIAGWDYALQLAGWPEDYPVWTGSCPCQPFSIAGRQRGVQDERHLWPKWKRLIEECLPPVIFGEQVASPLGRNWLDIVSSDLEALGYAVGAADLCAAGVGAPHIRQRLWFVAERLAYTESAELQGRLPRWESSRGENKYGYIGCDSTIGRVADTEVCRRKQLGKQHGDCEETYYAGTCNSGRDELYRNSCSINYFWSDCDWLFCQDGKWRPVESGTFPLADGVPKRVGRLRAYGNAIVPQVAAIFIKAFCEVQGRLSKCQKFFV